MVDTLALGASAPKGCAGSSPVLGTIIISPKQDSSSLNHKEDTIQGSLNL